MSRIPCIFAGTSLTFPFLSFLGAIGGAIAGSLAEDYAKDHKKHGGSSPGRQGGSQYGGSSQGGFMDQASGFFKK